MKVRIRFVLILTLVVSAIVGLSILLIYFLYADARRDDYTKRLWAEAYHSYINYYNISSIDKEDLIEMHTYFPGVLFNLEVIMLDDSGTIILKKPDTLHYEVNSRLLEKIKSSGESGYYYKVENNNEATGFYFSDAGHNSYVIASAYDKFGIIRLAKLRIIMIFVTLGAIIITALFSFFHVIHATQPLVKLSLQMRRVTESNLKDRFRVGRGNIKDNELVQIATNFNNMIDRLEHAFEMQKSFVHNASHELRTPLANMLSQTEAALRKDLTPEEAKAVLQSLKEDQHELIELSNSLLLLSQYEKIQGSQDWPALRIDEVLYDTIAAIKKMLPNSSINLEFSVMPENELSLSVKGNDTLMRSAFRNLIKNALQYSDDRHVGITIGADEKEISIFFDNRGKTLDWEERTRLFIPFFRGVNARRKKGFGLGLSIVKRIVTLHEGKIAYDIIDGNINRFKVTFPKI